MPNRLFLSAVFLLFPLCVPGAEAPKLAAHPPRRISSKIIDLGKVQPIYIVAGMATIIEIPGPVTGVRTGNPEDVQYFRSEKPDNEVTIVLKNTKAQPTNLIPTASPDC